MTETLIRGREVVRPTPDPLPSSVLDHATVVDNSKFGLVNNEGLWPSYNCLDLLIPTALCPSPVAEADFKTFSVAGWVPGFQFAVHGGVQCQMIGLDREDQRSEVERVFERSEGKGVEMALLLNRFVVNEGPGSDEPLDPSQSAWEEPVDLGTVTGIGQALAALEGYAATVYVGLPTLHLPRAAVLLAFGQGLITERDGKFYTKTGAKVAAGGGYDVYNPEQGLDDRLTMYATGEVYVERSERLSFNEVVIPGDGSGEGSDQNGLSDNTAIALVERAFRVGVDCFVAKVETVAYVMPQ